jgi:hypothetical protein
MNNICFLFKNLFNYDEILPPPLNLDSNIDTIYITDSNDISLIFEKGWKYVYIINQFNNSYTQFEKRKAIAYINCYPERIVPELNRYDYIFICDSNVIKMDTNYSDFLSKVDVKYACYFTSGYYSGSDNNIISEYIRSIAQSRWSYNHENMTKSINRYTDILNDKNIDIYKIPVVSAKYIGWNINHENKNIIADYVYNEYSEHLQGNIIFSMVYALYSDIVYNYMDFMNDGCVNNHSSSY